MKVNEKQKTLVTLPSDLEIEVSRSFDAPRELIWQMYTRSEHLVHWWGPTGWTLPVSEMDFRVGGSWFYCMQGPDGMKACGRSDYLEIAEPDRIVYKDFFVDDSGGDLANMPVAHSTLWFTEEGARTKVRTLVRYPTKKDRDTVIKMGMEAGIDQTLDRLEAYLRDFN